MKKRLYLLIPVVLILTFGAFMVPTKAATINDPQNDIIALRTWMDDGNSKIDCDWVPTNVSMIDIESISWYEIGDNYTVNMTFYGTPNADLLENGTVYVNIFFLIDGTSYPDDVETETPEANLTISSVMNGTVSGNETSIPITDIMKLDDHTITWNFDKTIAPGTPVALENWDLMAFASYSFDETINNITYSNVALDHYNFDYLEDTLNALCALLNLEIPGYSLIVVGVISVITIGVLLKKKYKK